MTHRAKLPGLPRVATQDQALNRWITAVAERLEVREGSRGDPGERAVTVKELQTLTRNAVKVVGGELVASGALTGGADPTADPNFVARLEEAIRNTRLYQGLVKRLDDPGRFDDLATEVRQALASSIAQEALSRGADIRRLETKIQTSDRSLAMAVEELTAAIGTSAAGIREVKSAFATADRAQAAKVTQLEARLDIPIADADKLPLPPAAPYASLAALKTAVPKGVTGKYYRVAGAAGDPELLYAWNGKDYLLAGEGANAKLEEVMKVTADRVTGAESEYTMKVEATTGGVTAVAGFGLSAAVDPSGSKTSAFIVRADKFAVVAPGDTSDADRYPFGVDANGVFINGTLRINSGGKTAEELANDFYLTATGQVFTQNPNTDTLTPASVTLTAVRKGTIVTGGTLTFASSPAGLLSVSGNTATIQSSAFAANSSVKVTATLTHNNATYTDEFTLYKVTGGADALVGFLTNESHALPASADGVVSSYTGAGGDFTVFKGSTKLTSGVTYSVASNPQSLTVSINSATGAYSMTGGLDVDLATVTFRATIGAQTIDKVFTLTRSKAGAAGTSGNYTDYVFIRSDSTPGTPTATSGIPAGWSDTPPTTGTGMLYMSKAVKKADGTVVGSWSVPARLDGKIGADGKYTEYQYAVNSSATVAPTSGWQASPPSVSSGQFLWMQSRVVDPAAALPAWGTAVRISGEKGDPGIQGIAGTPGANGVTYYTWVKYADSPTSGMSDYPSGKAYLGIAYNQTTQVESTNYGDYNWSLIKGTDGQPGTNGANGVTYYTWIKYADNASGSGMSDSPTGKTYIGLAVNKTTATESTDAADYNWSLIQGPQGSQGPQGPQGAQGAQGTRGAAFATSTAESPSDSAFTTASGLSPAIEGDQLMLTNSSGSTIYTRRNGSWTNSTALQVHGDAVITGTLSASKIVSGSITATQLSSGSVTADKVAAKAITVDKISSGETADTNGYFRIGGGSLIDVFNATVQAGVYSGVDRGAIGGVNSAADYPAVYGVNTGSGYGGGFYKFTSSTKNTQIVGGYSAHAAFAEHVSGGKSVTIADSTRALYSATGKGKFYAVDGVGPFTGVHDGLTDQNPGVGDIMVDHEILIRESVSSSVASFRLSSQPNQRGAIGVCAEIFDEPPSGWKPEESPVAEGPAPVNPVVPPGMRVVDVNALGEGLINVCGENGNFDVGDLIVTSSMPGKGMVQMKDGQKDDVVRSYTVAKVRENVTFSSPTEVKMVACIYLCG